MSCSCIGVGLAMGMLYVFVRIFEGIGHGNIIHFCYYNSNRGAGLIWLALEMGILGFCFVFGICLV